MQSAFVIFVVLATVSGTGLGIAFGVKKSKNAEEFLIDKKNALTIPPDFSKLPTPEAEKKTEINESDFDIENILQLNLILINCLNIILKPYEVTYPSYPAEPKMGMKPS